MPELRTILHVDMDAFFASVEQRDEPALRGKPVIVGGRSRRGVVAAASYEARRFGVRSAMSMVEAMQRCPHAEVVPPRMDRYVAASAKVFSIFENYTPVVEGLSIDEAFLDVSGSRRLFGDGQTIARRIKEDIFREVGLRASAGVAPNKFVAKIASDLDKPNGLVVVAPEGVAALLAPLPIERMWGVGPKAAGRLHGYGYRTFGDLAATPLEILKTQLGDWGEHLHQLSQGIDERPLVCSRDAKSLGAEMTFEKDLRTRPEFEEALLRQAVRVAGRLAQAGLRGDVISLKIKYRDHRTKTRQQRLPEPIFDTDSIYAAARELLKRFPELNRGVRLTGISLSGLQPLARQRSLFEDEQRARREKIEAVTLALRERFGDRGVKRGALVNLEERATGGEGGLLDEMQKQRSKP